MTDPAPIAIVLPQAAHNVTSLEAAPNRQDPRARTAAARQMDGGQKISVEEAIATAARSTTVDFDFLVAQARVESAMNPKARAQTSSATGLYQFIESTWLDTMKRHGARFGMGEIADQIRVTPSGSAYVPDAGQRAAILNLRNDPQVASLMAAGLAEDNRAHLMPILGRQPEAGELYLAHFLGAGGAGRFLSAMQNNPDQSAASLFRRPAAANRAVFYEPGGAPRSLAGVMDHLGSKMARAMSGVPDMPEGGVLPFSGIPAGYTPSYPMGSENPVPYLITAEEVFAPRTPVPVTGGRATPQPAPYIPTAATLPMPGTPRARSSQSMSDLLGETTKATGVRDLASPESLERIERAYDRLRSMGL